MQVIQDSNFGQLLSAGMSQGLQSLIDLKLKNLQEQNQMSGLQYLYPNADPQALRGLAALDPRILQGALKGREQAQAINTARQRAQQVLGNLQELQKTGSLDTTFGFGGGDRNTYDLYSGELEKLLKQIDPALQVPTSKMDKQAREEGLMRIAAALGQQGLSQAGMSSNEPMQQLAEQQMLAQQRQPDAEQQQSVQQLDESPLGSVLRNIANAGISNVAPLLNLAGLRGLQGATPAGQAVLGSDVVQTMESLLPAAAAKLVDMLPGDPRQKQIIQKRIEQLRPKEENALSNYLPTTSNIKKLVGQALPDQYFTPKSQAEQDMQDYIGTAVNIFSYGGQNFKKALTAATTSKGAGLAARGLGFSPTTQKTAEVVFAMMPDLIGIKLRGDMRKTASEAFDKFGAENNAKKIEMPQVQSKIEQISQGAGEFQSLKSNKDIVSGMNDLLGQFQSPAGTKPGGIIPPGTTTIENGIKMKRALWKMIDTFDLSDTDRKTLTDLARSIGSTIEQQAITQKMPFAKEFSQANQIWTGLMAGESMISQIKKEAKKGNLRSFLLRSIVGRYPVASGITVAGQIAGLGIPKSAVLGATAQELYQAYKFMSKTPGAWDKLLQATQQSALNNSGAAVRILQNLDKQAVKYEQTRLNKRKQRAIAGLK